MVNRAQALAGALAALALTSVVALVMITYAGSRTLGKAAVSAAATLIKASFPEVWRVIGNSTPKVTPADPNEYGEALSGYPTYIVEWNPEGVDVKVLIAVVGGGATPIRIDVTVNGKASSGAGSLIVCGDKILKEMHALYNNLLRDAEGGVGVKVIGFQILVNNTPVGFIDPSKPAIIPAQISWSEYFVGTVLAFTIVDDYPIVKAALSRVGHIRFAIGGGELNRIVSKHVNLSKVSSISKYLVIANETVRPAYLVTLGPWNNAVIMADNGEYLPRPTPTATPVTTDVAEQATPASTTGGWNFPVPRKYFPYFLSAVSMAVTAAVGFLIIRWYSKREGAGTH